MPRIDTLDLNFIHSFKKGASNVTKDTTKLKGRKSQLPCIIIVHVCVACIHHMRLLITGHHRSSKDNARQRVKSKPDTGSQSSSDEENRQFALPPPHSDTSSSESRKRFRASSMRSSPVLFKDILHADHYSSAGEYSTCSSTGIVPSSIGSRRWRKKQNVILLTTSTLSITAYCSDA